ncbi:MAG: histidinol phosphate phosphatase domain-containing protein [Deltaproteobacteria bacterium]|nr:histidinol phosphate phosphatase domain-containing protein [Deltaproteobacteria bacterium]
MIDLHTHSIFSDGELIPSELIRRAMAAGYRAIAITDHADHSNLDFILPRVSKACRKISEVYPIKALAGIEITHVPPVLIPGLVKEARQLGAKIVVIHGETIVEPVAAGTNRAAIEARVDILAHPGLITPDLVKKAAKNGVFLEITTRQGHGYTNGHVARLAREFKAPLVMNTDSHAPRDLVTLEMARKIAAGAGLQPDEIKEMFRNSEKLVRRSL